MMRDLFRTLIAVWLVAPILIGGANAQTSTCQGRQILLLDFRSPTLQSGTALSVGAVYRFANVATGVDALVTIDAITSGSLTIIDRDTGLVANFQPELGGSNARSADFTIALVTAGGSTPVSADFAASGIDIDGDSASLREYAEFSTPMASYVLETPTNLDVNASGPSVPANIRFESRTNFTAPGIDPTATANIVSVQYTATASFKYRIGVLGTGATVRLTSLDFTCPVLNFPTPTPQVSQDFSDAPASYGDPIHDLVAGVRLGAANTAETAGYNSPTASGDAGDDGVTIPALAQTQSATVSATVVGAGGRLQGWIDWNGDGDFADAGEQVATNIEDNGAGDTNPATGTIAFAVTPPAIATTSLTFARLRWATQSDITATMTASNGEVEDYALTIAAYTPPASCPAGQLLLSQSGNATAVQSQTGVATPANAIGALAAAGTTPPDGSSAEINDAADVLVLDLGAFVPQYSMIVLSAARDGGGQGNTARADIQFSPDNFSYSSAGTYGAGASTYPSAAQDILERNNVTVPAGGARYVRFNTLDSDDIFIDGVAYSQVCIASATLTAVKSVAVHDPLGAGLFATPGNDMVYTIAVTNVGTGPAEADSLFIVDALPAEVEFYNDDFDGAGPVIGPVSFAQSGAGLTFSAATDLRFSNAATPPATFAACVYTAAPGYDPAIRFACFNPKGAMLAADPDPSFTAQFRARIK